ncbi:hypothetical protein JAAARDRAFT_201024 [Jaapia argillacea MUCL 33604]|uniref:Uncharacterized protein n=1 Tax=Jaapia argillacea MUCL 33604 TaxID=933084 RepID=A0A067P2U0_9AGAM|nr:hypothetical protein JAAARDRAFT_201024 [Jaapia argillacea MUCL 33604]
MAFGNPHKMELITAIRSSFNPPCFALDDYSLDGTQWVTLAGWGLGPRFLCVKRLPTTVEKNVLGQWKPSDWAIYPNWFDERGRTACHDDVKRIETLLYEILPHAGSVDDTFPLPNLSFLNNLYTSLDDALARMWDCCHEALVKLGFVCYHLHTLPQWDNLTWLVEGFVEIVSELGLADEAPVQGAVIDILQIHQPFVTTLQLLRHSVPVTYVWGDDERAAVEEKPTWLQWEPSCNGARSTDAIQTEAARKKHSQLKQPSQSKQPPQTKLSKVEKKQLKEEKQRQADCESDDTALAVEGDPQVVPAYPATLSAWYRIPLFELATKMDVDMNPNLATNKPMSPSGPSQGVDGEPNQPSPLFTPPRHPSPSPRPLSLMEVLDTSLAPHTAYFLLPIPGPAPHVSLKIPLPTHM